MTNLITCHAGTTRNGEHESCGKLAVTWADPSRYEDGGDTPWPVCAYHAHMGGALPLYLHPAGNPACNGCDFPNDYKALMNFIESKGWCFESGLTTDECRLCSLDGSQS